MIFLNEVKEDNYRKDIKMEKPMIEKSFDEVAVAFDEWLETLSPEEVAEINKLIDETNLIEDETASGIQIVEDDSVEDEPKAQKKTNTIAPKEQKEDGMDQPKAEKVKCKCCGFAKKPRRMLPSGLCKVCDLAFRDESGEVITDGDTIEVVGRQGKRGRNNVSIVHPITGRRWTVKRKVRLES